MTRTSTSSVLIGTGFKTFTYDESLNLGWTVGTRLRASYDLETWVEGPVSSVSSTSVTILCDATSGSGVYDDWNIAIAGQPGGANFLPNVTGLVKATAVAGGASGDPYFDKVVSHLKCNGPNNSTNIIDECGALVSVNGNLAITTSTSVFNGSCLSFDGTGDYATVPHNPAFSATNPNMCYMAWVRPTASKSDAVIMTKRPSTGAASEFTFVLQSLVPIVGAWSAGGTNVLASAFGAPLPLNTWSHIALLIIDGVLSVYVNGVQVGSSVAPTGAIGSNSQPLYIGRDPTNTSGDWIGQMDDISITMAARDPAYFNLDAELPSYQSARPTLSVVPTPAAAVTAPSGGGVVDSEARAAIGQLIDRLQGLGLLM